MARDLVLHETDDNIGAEHMARGVCRDVCFSPQRVLRVLAELSSLPAAAMIRWAGLYIEVSAQGLWFRRHEESKQDTNA